MLLLISSSVHSQAIDPKPPAAREYLQTIKVIRKVAYARHRELVVTFCPYFRDDRINRSHCYILFCALCCLK